LTSDDLPEPARRVDWRAGFLLRAVPAAAHERPHEAAGNFRRQLGAKRRDAACSASSLSSVAPGQSYPFSSHKPGRRSDRFVGHMDRRYVPQNDPFHLLPIVHLVLHVPRLPSTRVTSQTRFFFFFFFFFYTGRRGRPSALWDQVGGFATSPSVGPKGPRLVPFSGP
jgi:hypothetical protein